MIPNDSENTEFQRFKTKKFALTRIFLLNFASAFSKIGATN